MSWMPPSRGEPNQHTPRLHQICGMPKLDQLIYVSLLEMQTEVWQWGRTGGLLQKNVPDSN